MLERLKTVDPEGKFKFFKLLSVGDQFYNCDFYQHEDESKRVVFNVKVERPDRSTTVVQLVKKEKWMPVTTYPGISDDLVAKMNTVIEHNSPGYK